MIAKGFFNVVLVLSFLFSNLGGMATSQIKQPSPINNRDIFSFIGVIDSWLERLGVDLFGSREPTSEEIKATETPTPGFGTEPTIQPSKTSVPTISPTWAPTITPSSTSTPEPTYNPTITPTGTITPSITPTQDQGLIQTSFEISLEPDPAQPGDIITATWTIRNYRGMYDGMEIWAYLPEAFTPLEMGEGSFDPATNLLVMPINGPDGILSWSIDGNAEPPYTILVEIHVNGQVLLSVSRQLGQRGPDLIPMEGGEAHGFNRHVKVSFPPGALPEAVDVSVRAPRDPDLGLGGHPMELTAIGRSSGKEITQFNQPITITVQYTDEEAERQLKNARMKDESSLTLFYYDETQATWIPLPTIVDAKTNTLTAITNHFSLQDFKAQNWEAARLPSLDGFQVANFTGAATYSFPIQVPPGPGGQQPGLELTYNSQEIDSASSRTQASWVGMGWSLETGFIQRSMNGTPNYFGDDTFSLVMNNVGGLLLPIPDQDGDPNTIDYHFANERFWRVRQYLASGDVYGYPGDKSRWVIFAPDGNQYYFGGNDGMAGHAWYVAYPNGCSSVTMQTWKWGLTKQRSIFGKEMTYEYSSELSPTQKYAPGCPDYPATVYEALYPESIIYANNRYRIVLVREKDINGVGYRTDYDTAWNASASTMLYMRSKLLRIEAWNDPNGIWNSGDEVLIRKYVLNYGENNQQLLPGITWPAGGKTPTLTSISEYGLNGTSALPKTTFTYNDLHLTEINNGYGGKIAIGYDNWHAEDGFDSYLFNPDGVTYSPGEHYPDEFNQNELDLMKDYYQPGSYYKIVAQAWYLSGDNHVKVGLDDGTTHIYGGTFDLINGQWVTITSTIQLPADASISRGLIYCWGQCKLGRYEVFPLVSRYRVVDKTVTDEVTANNYEYLYAYEGAAVNDAGTSDYVLGDSDGSNLMTKPNTEFRGHRKVTEIDPDGRQVETLFKQDDIYKGQAYQNQVRNGPVNIYTQAYYYFAYANTPTDNLPHPEGEVEGFYADLKIIWTYTTMDTMRYYNGDIYAVTSRNEYDYNISDQGGTQYGNRTRTTSSYYSSSVWVPYRGARMQYYPNVTNGAPEGSRYLVGLPAYRNSYQCPGGCDWAAGDLLSSHLYLYDTNSDYYFPPINGIPKGDRVFVEWDGPNPKYADTAYTFDAWGNRNSLTQYTNLGVSFGSGGEAQTSSTCYGWGTAPACYSDGYNTYPAWETNALGQTTKFGYDKSLGMPTSVSDPNDTDTNDTTISARYDAYGRMTSITRPGDSYPSNPTAILSYHTESAPFSGKPFWTEAQQRITGSTYFKIRKYYDGLGRLIQTQVVGATIGTQSRDILVDAYYDSASRVTQQSVPYDVITGSNYHTRDTGKAHTTTTYDILGRSLTSTATDGTQTTSSYWDGYINNVPYLYTQVTNPRGYSTTTRSDLWGRTVNVTPPTGPQVDYSYDAADHLVSVLRGGATTTIEYDYAGRKISMDDPDMRSWSYSYDAIGNLSTQTDARECITTLSYDVINRLTGKTYSTTPTGTCGATTTAVTYTYDYGTNGIGRRTGMSDGSGDTSWTYDTRGRMTQESKHITGSGTFKTTWSFNSADLMISMTYPGDNNNNIDYAGEVVNYSYLPQMLLDTILGTVTYVNDTVYDASGRVELRDLGINGMYPAVRVDYTYYEWSDINGQGKLKQLTSGVYNDTDSLQDLRYTYDANGNILTIKDYKAANPQTQTFTYDGLDRLTSAVASGGGGGIYGSQTYIYNSTTGNLSNKAGVSYTYGDANHAHAVTLAGSDSFSYDANGNQTGRTVVNSNYTLSYDAENRLVGVTGGVNASFVYDGDGNRVIGTIGTSSPTTYIGNYLEWKTNPDDMVKYYYAGSTRVAMRTGSTLNYLLGDHLGSQAITTDSSGVKTGEKRYYPWGTERYTYGTTPTTYRFTGQRTEFGLGLMYYGARWYDPVVGRFIQADSIIPNAMNSQAFDRYAYVLNNPVNYTDPSGYKYCDSFDEYGNCVTENDVVWPSSSATTTSSDNFPSTEPSDLNDGGLTAFNSIMYLRTLTGAWWGSNLTTQELIAIILFLEASVGLYKNSNGVWYMDNCIVEAMSRQYNEHCGDGAWSANCFIGFWAYYQPILQVLGPQSKLDEILANNLNNFGEYGDIYIRTAGIILNNNIGGEYGFGDNPTEWVTLSLANNHNTYLGVINLIYSNQFPFFYFYEGNNSVFIVLSVNLAISLCGGSNCVYAP